MRKIGRAVLRRALVGAIAGLAMLGSADAARRTEFPARFAARAVSVSGTEDAGRIDIYVERWSTDAEYAELLEKLEKGRPGELLALLERQPLRAGVVLMPGVQAHGDRARTRTPKNLKFAREIVTPAGRQVLLASDEHLGLGESQLEARQERYEFSLLDIRLGPDGTGIGKVGAARDVVYDAKRKALSLKDDDRRPARLVHVTAATR
jgi:hypothetical protein